MKHLTLIVIGCLLISLSFGQPNNSDYNSDYYRISKEIENNYKRWLEKGEFEKSADFQIRINKSSIMSFDSICYEILIGSFKTKSGFKATLLKYDADNEKFEIEFNFVIIPFMTE